MNTESTDTVGKAKDFSPNENFHYLVNWMVERQRIFWRRFRQESGPPWTGDPVMYVHKFTNVYRVLDRASQFLLREVIYNGRSYSVASTFWRILLYKHFNLPSTWRYLTQELGDITIKTPPDSIVRTLKRYHARGYHIYSNAYMLTASFMRNEGTKKRLGIEHIRDKHEAYLRLFEIHVFNTGLWRQIFDAPSFTEAYTLMRTIPTVGPFLAYQYVQDLNYTPLVSWDDNEFCAPGNGTIRGVDRTFSGVRPGQHAEVVRWAHQRLLVQLKYEGKFEPLPDHWPTVADVSNCFCETDKYMRAKGIEQPGVYGKRVKNLFHPTNEPIEYMFPPKWGVKPLQ